MGVGRPRDVSSVSNPPSSYSMRVVERSSREMWSTVWEPRVWPSLTMRLSSVCAVPSFATLIWLLVLTKNVAFKLAAARSSSTFAVLVGSGASSNDSATVCRHQRLHVTDFDLLHIRVDGAVLRQK